MAGAYLYDVMIGHMDVLATIHHVMAPGLIIWIRSSYATNTPSDALMNRLLATLVFFGAAIGGTICLGLTLCFRLFKFTMNRRTLR